MDSKSQSTKCSGCGLPLFDECDLPCPACGDTRRTTEHQVEDLVHFHDSVAWQQVREYYEHHPFLLPLVVVITIGAPFLGLILAGWLGIVVGLAVGIATFFLGLRAVTTVREIREGHEP